MDQMGTVYSGRRNTRRQLIMLAAAVAAVLLMTFLVAAACAAHRDRQLGSLAASPAPSAVADQDLPGGSEAGGQSAGLGQSGGSPSGDNGGDDGEAPDGQGEEPPPAPPAGEVLQGYQVVQESHVVAADGFLRSSARCPVGTVVLGGGARLVGEESDDFGTIVQESVPGTIGGQAQSLWLVAFRNPGPVPRTVEIRAVCAEPPPGYEVVRVDAALPAGGFIRQSVVCPAGLVALGGGAQVVGAGSADFRTVVQESAPGAVNGTTDVWVVAMTNTGAQERTIGFKAVCAEPPSGLQVVGEQMLVPASGFASAEAVCPAGTVVLGGGGPGVISGSEVDYRTVVRESAPGVLDDRHRWMSAVANQGDEAFSVTVRAVCAHAD